MLTLLSCGQSNSARDASTNDAGRQPCLAVMRPDPCLGGNPLCIADFRSVKATFPTCFAGFDQPAWLNPFVVSCGPYDGLRVQGLDSATTYYFDRLNGHVLGFTNTGVTTLPGCEAIDPAFVPTPCDMFETCPGADGGADALVD